LGILPSQPPNWTATEPSTLFFCGDVVECIRIVLVLPKTAFRVVNGDRPEAVDRDVALDGQLVDSFAVLSVRVDVEIFGFAVGISAPGKGGTYPLSHLYGHFGLVRLSRLGHEVSWVKA
jgi:hypothetical protein